MNDLYDWLFQQHRGLRTFQLFRQKLARLAVDEPDHRALYTLLSLLAARYIDAFDEEPVPIPVADRTYENLLRLVATLDLSASAERRLADLNRVAAVDLLDPSTKIGSDSRELRYAARGNRPEGPHRLTWPVRT
jgi:hypothetical protein